MTGREIFIGYDADDQPVVLIDSPSHIPNQRVVTLEFGVQAFHIRRVAPGLVESLRASITRNGHSK